MRSALPPAALALARAEFALPNPELRSRGRRRTGTPAGGSVGLTYGASDTSASSARCRVWRDAARAEHDASAERSRTALRQAAAAAAPRELGAETAVGAGARVGGRADAHAKHAKRAPESRSRAASGFPGCARRRPGPHSPSLTCLLGRALAALAALLPRSRRRAAGVARYPPLRLEQRMPWRAANPRRALGDARWVTRWFTDVPLEQARWEQRRTWRAPRARRCCT